MSSGYIPTREQSERIGRAVTHYERTAALLPPLEQRRIVGGGGGSCSTQIRILIMGRPTGGTVTLPVTVNSVTENVVLNYDDNATDLETAFEGHSEISPGQIVGNSMGGQLPFQELWITFDNGLSASDVTIGNATDALTGGFAMYSVIRKCCG